MIPLRDIRRQILSVRKISHITRAMKTVSAIRLMRVQTQVVRQKPYALKLREIVADLVARTPAQAHPLLRRRSGQVPEWPSGQVPGHSTTGPPDHSPSLDHSSEASRRRMVCLAFGSDRGLCGPFNYNLVLEIDRFLNANRQHDVRLMVVGKRLRDMLRARKRTMAREFVAFYQGLTWDKVVHLGEEFLDDYRADKIGELWVIYTEFKSGARQRVAAEQLLPIGGYLPEEPLFPEYRYEPNVFSVLDRVLPMYYHQELWRIIRESEASEHIARMQAMDMATVNAGELIRDLTLKMNKTRQEAITRELAEISTAAEVLRG